MRAIYLFLLLLVVFLCFPGLIQAQSDLTVGPEIKIDNHGSYDFLIPANLDTLVYPSIRFTAQGADGGRARHVGFFDNSKIAGGGGAKVAINFDLGFGKNKLSPGGTIRFIVGEHGENCSSQFCGGGGGGGTAILYKHPGAVISPSNDTVVTLLTQSSDMEDLRPTNWVLLAVGGGGSGATVEEVGFSNFTSNEGETGRTRPAGQNAGPEGVNEGGVNGGDGLDSEDVTGGHGYLDAGFIGQPAQSGSGANGGSGFGAGGSVRNNKSGSGGGGGFSGGGAGENNLPGGGGGSFGNNNGYNPNGNGGMITVTNNTRFPDDGIVTYQFLEDVTPGDAPVARCRDNFPVILTGGESVTLTVADFDDGSYDPNGFPITLQMCQSPDGVEFICRESRTWACNEVGDRETWYLVVSNGYRTSYCQPTLTIEEAEAAPVCPFSGRTVVNLNGQCTKTFSAAELAHLNTIDCANSFPDVDVVLLGNPGTRPTDFFTNGYTFSDGTTYVVYRTQGGSCAYEIEVNADPGIININCPANQEVDLNDNDCDITIAAANLALDYNGPGTITHRIEPEIAITAIEGSGQLADYTLERGETFFRYYVEEPGGCTAECAFSVTANWNATNPVDFACQDATYPHSLGNLDYRAAYLSGLVRAEDDCGASPVSLALGFLTECNAVNVPQEVRLSVGNGAFEQTCSFNLTLVSDFTPNCSPNPLFVTIEDEVPLIVAPEAMASWMASPEITATTNLGPLDCDSIGRRFVTITLEDRCGNTGSCVRDVRIQERSNPTLTCQNISRALDENGEARVSYADVLVSAADNCGSENLVFTLEQSLFTCSDRGVNQDIFLSAEDPAGNVGRCRVDITITDQTFPEITCQDATIELGEDGTYRLGVAEVVLKATDNCSVGYRFSQRNFTCDDLANSPISVTMTGRDPTGNSSNCTSVVTIAEPECPCLPSDNGLIIDNPEDVALCADMTVSSVRFLEGNLDLQGYELTIETDGGRILNEAATERMFDFTDGSVVAFDLTDADQDLIADLGIQMAYSSPGPFSFNEMRRSTQPVLIGEDTSIQRVLTIDHVSSQPLENIWISYFEAELNGTPEEDLELYIEENGVWSLLPKNGQDTEFNHLTFDIDFNNYTSPVRLTLAPAAALLPLDLLSFTGEAQDKTNVLTWSTANEEAFSHFEVQRSSAEAGAQRPDASAEWWENMGEVAGAMNVNEQGTVTSPLSPGEGLGERSYTFTDATPQRHNYYRLRMVDLDGSFSYSPVIYLQNPLVGSASSADELRVFPNPNAGTFQIALPEVAGEMDLAVYTIHGTRVRAQKIGARTTKWEMEDQLNAGIYLVSVTARNGELWTKKVVVR